MNESIPFYSSEIEEFLTGKYLNVQNCTLKIEKIEELNYTIDAVFGNRFFTIIYLTNPESEVGHFTLLSHFEGEIEFFDSTGNKVPDIIKKFAEINGMKLVTNKKVLQGRETNTCAKWCIARILSLPLKLDVFQKIFNGNRHYKADDIVNNLYILKKDE